MFQNDVAYPLPSLETVCSDGNWIGMSKDKNYDVFRLFYNFYIVNRINGKIRQINDDELPNMQE